MVSKRALKAYLDQPKEDIICPSSDAHGDRITDVVHHYLGCLPYREREAYYNSLQENEQEQIEIKIRRVEWIRREMAGSDEKLQLQHAQHSLQRWRRLRQLDPRSVPDLKGRQKDNDPLDHGSNAPQQADGKDSDEFEPYDADADTLAHVILFDEDGRGITDTQRHQTPRHSTYYTESFQIRLFLWRRCYET